MQSANMSTDAETGWGIDWHAHGTWWRLLLVSIQLFIMVSMTPVFVATFAAWAWSATVETRGLLAMVLGTALVLIQITGLNAMVGGGLFDLPGWLKRGSWRDRALFYGWGTVFAVATVLLTAGLGQTLDLGFTPALVAGQLAVLTPAGGTGYIVTLLRGHANGSGRKAQPRAV